MPPDINNVIRIQAEPAAKPTKSISAAGTFQYPLTGADRKIFHTILITAKTQRTNENNNRDANAITLKCFLY